MARTSWWSEGIRFQCQGSGKCCASRGSYGFVYLTLEDRRALAQHLGIRTAEFTRKYCGKTDGFFHLKDEPGNPDCAFLEGGNRCGVYEARSIQCRTWPFWPENMSPKAWRREVVAFCPGVGKGPLVKPATVEQELKKQEESERLLLRERT